MNLEILDSIKRKVTFTIKKEDVNRNMKSNQDRNEHQQSMISDQEKS